MTNEQPRAGAIACAQCGTPFTCAIAAGESHCWCFDLPQVMKVEPNSACLCPNCLREAIRAQVEGK